MTDNEIIKTLEANIHFIELLRRPPVETRFDVLKNALDLINRQKAEVERLEHIRKGDEQLINSLNKCYKLAKCEAIKEFAGKLENVLDKRLGDDIPILADRDNVYCTVDDIYNEIDNLVKEMTEVKQDEK